MRARRERLHEARSGQGRLVTMDREWEGAHQFLTVMRWRADDKAGEQRRYSPFEERARAYVEAFCADITDPEELARRVPRVKTS